jgi:hypothetical protein
MTPELIFMAFFLLFVFFILYLYIKHYLASSNHVADSHFYYECSFIHQGKLHSTTFLVDQFEEPTFAAHLSLSNYCSAFTDKNYSILSIDPISAEEYQKIRKELHLKLGHYHVYSSN